MEPATRYAVGYENRSKYYRKFSLRISTIHGRSDCLVLSVYEVGGVKYFAHFEMGATSGPNVVKEDEVVCIEGSISDLVECKSDAGQAIFIDPIAFELGLYDRLLDHEQEAIEEFWKHIQERRQSGEF